MWKLSRNNRGVTLVEVLAVLVLMSLILLMINGVHQYGQKQFVRQNEQIQNQENVQFAVKYITREVRKRGTVEKNEEEQKLIIGADEYLHKNNAIYKNDKPLVEGIKDFKTRVNDKPRRLELTIISIEGSQGNTEEAKTVIYLREGDKLDEQDAK